MECRTDFCCSSASSLTNASTLDGDKLATPPATEAARKGVLRDTFFPAWRDDSTPASVDLEDPEVMQKKDPLGIQIWRLYSKAKNQLPNQERMVNLSWRMMSMNLKREQERARLDSS